VKQPFATYATVAVVPVYINNARSGEKRTHPSEQFIMTTPSTLGARSPIAQHFTKKRSSQIKTSDLPMEQNAIGYISPMGIFFTSVKLTVPLCYIYIILVLWRELCFSFPQTMLESHFIQKYFSIGVWIARTMTSSSFIVEVWASIEGIFYVILFLHRKWLNSLDTLELSLRNAPMLELGERDELWQLMMDGEDECVSFISEWFFGEQLESLTKYDVMDFLTWSMFEGRNIEHLTQDESNQLRQFVEDLEYKISIELFGIDREGDIVGSDEKKEACDGNLSILQPPSPTIQLHQYHLMPKYGSATKGASKNRFKEMQSRPKPSKSFHFQENRDESHSSYFSNLYENYKDWCDKKIHPALVSPKHAVQDIRNFAVEKIQQLHDAEQSAVATASNMYEHAYFSLIEKDGKVDKQLTAISHATQSQIADVWNSMWKMKERLRTASDVSSKRKALRQQLKNYQQTLLQMRSMATAIPSNQMADLMKKITQCYEALESVERSAADAFLQVTGYVGKNLLHSEEPPRYLKYSADPLMDISSYPLIFHILILLVTEGGLRILMRMRGFTRHRVGPISYYYHSGTGSNGHDNNKGDEDVPIVFCHGIGIGLIFYMSLIDELLKIGRPLILPEIPYVNGFRPWLGPNSVLPPAAVSGTLMSILACHGFGRGAFMGHSYGTSW